jgi:hypothetical protein
MVCCPGPLWPASTAGQLGPRATRRAIPVNASYNLEMVRRLRDRTDEGQGRSCIGITRDHPRPEVCSGNDPDCSLRVNFSKFDHGYLAWLQKTGRRAVEAAFTSTSSPNPAGPPSSTNRTRGLSPALQHHRLQRRTPLEGRHPAHPGRGGVSHPRRISSRLAPACPLRRGAHPWCFFGLRAVEDPDVGEPRRLRNLPRTVLQRRARRDRVEQKAGKARTDVPMRLRLS